MEKLTSWSQLFLSSLESFSEKIMSTIPNIIGAVLILLMGWLFAKLVSNAFSRLLKIVRLDILADRIKATDYLRKANISLTPSQVIGRFIYWILLLLVLISASESLGWTAVSDQISKLLGWLPNLLVGILFFVVGTYIASFIRDFIKTATSSLGISTGKLVSSFVFYLLFAIVSLTALEQAGVDTSIITSNLLMILGAILLSASISYGYASRHVLSNILATFFSRRTFVVGQTIEIDGMRGKIIGISTISFVLKNDAGEKIVIPAHEIISKKVKILGG